MTKEKRLEKFISEIEKDLHHEITYYLYPEDYIDLVNQEIDLIDLLEDTDFFNLDIKGRVKANKIINDIGFDSAIEMARDFGYSINNIDSEALASIIESQKLRNKFDVIEGSIKDYIDNLNE